MNIFVSYFFSSLLRREGDSGGSLEAFLKNSGRNYNFRKTATALKYELADQNQPLVANNIHRPCYSYTNAKIITVKTLPLLGTRTAITHLLALKHVSGLSTNKD